MKKLLMVLFLVVFCLFSCHKDTDFEETEDTTTIVTPTIDNAKDGVVHGLVTDREGLPINGARVTIYDQSTVTDKYGVFKTNGILSPTGSLIKVEADGYFQGSDLLYSNTELGYTEITLIKKNNVKTFNAQNGGNVEIDGGGNIVFLPSSIVNKKGESYNGIVNVYAKRIGTDDSDFYKMMPGGLVAQDIDGRTVVLGSMGMIAVELVDDNGDELQIKDGYTAKTSFPIAEDMQPIANATIKTWSYNEEKGLWIEEGIAEKIGNNYVTEIPHFSFWNCDAPFPVIKLKGRIIDGEKPVENISITIEAEGFGIGYGYSMDGSFCGKIPKGAEFTLKVTKVGCQEVIHTETFGPFINDVDLGDIHVDYNKNYIQGTIFCLEDAVSDAYVILTVGDEIYIYFADNGSYEIDLSCFDDDVSLRAVDVTTGKASEVITVSADDFIVQDFQLCSVDCDLTLMIESNENEVCSVEEVMITAIVGGGSGNYQYSWDNSESQQTISYVGEKQYCLTVTDLDTECEETFCKLISFQDTVGITAIATFDFGCNNDNQGEIYVKVMSGDVPLQATVGSSTIQITDLDVKFSLGTFLEDDYTVALTDSRGCERLIPVEVLDVFEPWVSVYGTLESNFICEGEEMIITCYAQNENEIVEYIWSDGSSGQSIPVNTEGSYCVEVVWENGCRGSGCIDLVDFYSNFDPSQIYEYCINGDYYFNYTPEYLIMNPSNNTFNYIINPTNPETIPIDVSISDITSCSLSYEYQFVDNSALGGVNVTNTSCEGCEDGSITFINESANITCERCAFNIVFIYKIEDIENSNLVEYDKENLSAGEYVLIGTFVNNPIDNIGCVRVRYPFTVE